MLRFTADDAVTAAANAGNTERSLIAPAIGVASLEQDDGDAVPRHVLP